jgi:restriction endonuclease Mrr
MPLRHHDLLYQPIVDYLHNGERPAWEIEEELARQFKLTPQERAQLLRSGCPIWTNDVAFALKRLGEDRRIEKNGTKRAPNGGRRGVYRLP